MPNESALDLPEGGLSTIHDDPLFSIDYARLTKTSKKIGEKRVLALIKEAYLTGNIDRHIKRVLVRLPARNGKGAARG